MVAVWKGPVCDVVSAVTGMHVTGLVDSISGLFIAVVEYVFAVCSLRLLCRLLGAGCSRL